MGVSAAALCAGLLAGMGANAQPGLPHGRGRPPSPATATPRFATPPPEEGEAGSEHATAPDAGATRSGLRSRFGLGRATALLESGALPDKLRAIARLAGIGSHEAVDALIAALGTGAAVRQHPRTRLAAVRVLAQHTEQREVLTALGSVFATGQASGNESPLDTLGRATAAMALGKAGTSEALIPLVAALLQGGRTGAMAREAVLAHPPASLLALLGESKRLSPEMMGLLAELGDLRAIPLLRRQLTRKDPKLQRAAVLALAALGDGSIETLARSWLTAPIDSSLLRRAGAEALLLLGAAGAAEAVAGLMPEPTTRVAGLELALRHPAPALLPALRTILSAKDVTAAEHEQALLAVTRMGTNEAAGTLIEQLGRPELSTLAAFGLARSPAPWASQALAQALGKAAAGAPRRLVLRACLVRALGLGELTAGLGPALDSAFGSADGADRAVASFGLGVLGLKPIEELRSSKDRAVALGAAQAALALGQEAFAGCEPLLERAAALGTSGAPSPAPPLEAAFCGPSLLWGAAGVSPAVLADWAEGGGVLAPLSALALGRRDSRPFRSRLQGLLEGSDALIRAHAALGLGQSPQADSVSLLTEAYEQEAEPIVRRAIVRALSSARQSAERRRILELALDLDPDAETRALARSALAGADLRPDPVPAGSAVLWLSLVPSSAADQDRAAERAARLVRPDGLALPVVSAPDGTLIVAGLGRAGEPVVRLAPAVVPGEPFP